jgi:hypothetical protein
MSQRLSKTNPRPCHDEQLIGVVQGLAHAQHHEPKVSA